MYDDRDKLICSATLTLNRLGKCRLLVNEEELTQWQFRRMALEKLFFGPFRLKLFYPAFAGSSRTLIHWIPSRWNRDESSHPK